MPYPLSRWAQTALSGMLSLSKDLHEGSAEWLKVTAESGEEGVERIQQADITRHGK